MMKNWTTVALSLQVSTVVSPSIQPLCTIDSGFRSYLSASFYSTSCSDSNSVIDTSIMQMMAQDLDAFEAKRYSELF